MGVNQNNASNNMEKLASGLRINKAADDSAGLAISEKMRGQIRGLDQASRNAQDGISMIQTAEGSLGETHEILQRMRELATQAANDTNVGVDRNEIQKEMNSLTSEINRIGNTTEFNTQKLLNGGIQTAAVDVTEVTAGVAGTTTPATAATGTIAGLEFTATTAGAAGNTTTFAVETAVGNGIASSITVTGSDIVVTIGTDGAGAALTVDQDAVKALIDGNTDATNLVSVAVTNGTTAVSDTLATNLTGGTDATTSAGTPGVYTFDLTQPEAGNIIDVDGTTITFTDDATADAAGITAGTHVLIGTDKDLTAANLATAIGTNNTTLAPKFAATVTTGSTIQLTQEGVEIGDDAPVVTTAEEAGADGSFSANFQIGANSGQSLTLNVADMRSVALNVSGDIAEGVQVAKDGSIASYVATENVTDGTNNTKSEFALDVSSHEKASAAISVINDAIESVSAERSNLGATQNRLEHTISNLGTSAENLQAAESRIRDVDMAREVMEMTKNNILSQASQAMLAQANQAPQSVLQLLG